MTKKYYHITDKLKPTKAMARYLGLTAITRPLDPYEIESRRQREEQAQLAMDIDEQPEKDASLYADMEKLEKDARFEIRQKKEERSKYLVEQRELARLRRQYWIDKKEKEDDFYRRRRAFIFKDYPYVDRDEEYNRKMYMLHKLQVEDPELFVLTQMPNQYENLYGSK